MRWWDLPEVLAIERAAFGPTAWSEEAFWSELARVGIDRHYVVADMDEAVAGYGGLWLSPPDADVQTVAVAGHARGRGLGRALLEELAGRARADGCRRLHLEVRADNEPARGLYASAGFRAVRTRAGYYPDGSDALVMEREL